MEIKEIIYQDRVPKNMISKFNYFVKDFLNEYSDQLEEMEAGSNMTIKKEYEGDLEVYFVEFSFYRKGGGIFTGYINNEIEVTCNDEFWGNVILEWKIKTLSLDSVIFFVFVIEMGCYFFNVVFVFRRNVSIFEIVLIIEVIIYWIFAVH